ncbi:MAG: tRNA (adenosine(37)-N6)-threonylcarbamoyltransferase complex dimerization subunit type 1 TsaB [Vicinamibacterales bacterium]
MLILALDTTTRAGSAAVLRDGQVLALVPGDPSRTHGERLPGELAEALAAAGVGARDVELLAVASGPGAFTGLRIGLATMQGLAMTLGTPVVGVSALEALAETAAPDLPTGRSIGAWMDAARGEVFSARYTTGPPDEGGVAWAEQDPPQVASPGDTLTAWEPVAPDMVFIGDGATRYLTDGRWTVLEGGGVLAPAIGRLAARAARRGQAGPPHALQPLYVRRPDAILDRERRSQA